MIHFRQLNCSQEDPSDSVANPVAVPDLQILIKVSAFVHTSNSKIAYLILSFTDYFFDLVRQWMVFTTNVRLRHLIGLQYND